MKREYFLNHLKSPLPNADLRKYPKGRLMQYWAENPDKYSNAFGKNDLFNRYLGGHNGIDIATTHRDPVYASHDGFVQKLDINRAAAGGLCVWLESEPLEDKAPNDSKVITVYAHLDEIKVKVGQKVKQGEVIGLEGNTGFVRSGNVEYWGNAPAGKGTHLHFGLYEFLLQNGVFVPRNANPMNNSADPLPYITDPTPDNGEANGDLSGLAIFLENMLKYLKIK